MLTLIFSLLAMPAFAADEVVECRSYVGFGSMASLSYVKHEDGSVKVLEGYFGTVKVPVQDPVVHRDKLYFTAPRMTFIVDQLSGNFALLNGRSTLTEGSCVIATEQGEE